MNKTINSKGYEIAMKRILALTITLVIVATVLTGCGKTQNKTSTSNQVIRATIASEPKTWIRPATMQLMAATIFYVHLKD